MRYYIVIWLHWVILVTAAYTYAACISVATSLVGYIGSYLLLQGICLLQVYELVHSYLVRLGYTCYCRVYVCCRYMRYYIVSWLHWVILVTAWYTYAAGICDTTSLVDYIGLYLILQGIRKLHVYALLHHWLITFGYTCYCMAYECCMYMRYYIVS